MWTTTNGGFDRLLARLALCAVLAVSLAGCGPDYSPNTYASNAVQQANKVDQGVIVGVREVGVSASGPAGAAIGGTAGGIAGAQAGTGASSAFGALGGRWSVASRAARPNMSSATRGRSNTSSASRMAIC
jgi:outer membrane lipoprotein SlyB